MKTHRFHPEADAEYAEAAEYYSAIQPELGGRFYDEMESLIADVCNNPTRWKQFDPPARRRLALEFPYAVIYIDEPDHVWIVAIMPLRREPGYWHKRLP